MASSLLSRSLGDVKNQDAGAENGGRRVSGGAGGRGSPYSRPAAGADSWKHDMYSTSNNSNNGPRLDKNGRERRSCKLIISNLHYEVSERELELLFLQIGPLALPPKIKFDRSGRSQGQAYVTYTTDEHASKARDAFDGAPAKGENIRVEFDYRAERPAAGALGALGVMGAPAGSLLARLENDSQTNNPRRNAPPSGPRIPTGPAASRGASSNPRAGSVRGAPRGGARGGREPRDSGRKEVKSTGDLDKELEAFMGAPKPTNGSTAAVEAAPEVEMS